MICVGSRHFSAVQGISSLPQNGAASSSGLQRAERGCRDYHTPRPTYRLRPRPVLDIVLDGFHGDYAGADLLGGYILHLPLFLICFTCETCCRPKLRWAVGERVVVAAAGRMCLVLLALERIMNDVSSVTTRL